MVLREMGRTEEPHRRVEQGPGAELRNALTNEDFQVLWCRERSARHELNDILVALRETRVATVALYRAVMSVRVHDEGVCV